MTIWRIKQFGVLCTALAVLLMSLTAVAAPANAQQDRYATCSFYGLIVGSGGQNAADAAAALQALGAPNPAGVDNVLEVIINAESDVPPIGSRPTADAREVAYQELDNYFGGVCADLDICPLIQQAVATSDSSSAQAAALARGITAPAPPGIDAALALIAGQIAESPFHATVAEAQTQVAEYFPCTVAAPSPTPGVPTEVARACGDLAVLSIPEGPFAVAAAESLREQGAPTPPGIEAALDVIVQAADFSQTPPPLAEIDAALATLDGYFGGPCSSLDRCAFVAQIGGADAAAGAEAARLLRRIETPSPPGIDAALALIAGDITESPFHDTVEQARDQVLAYYPCGGTSGDGDGGGLAFTGSSLSAPLAFLGAALVASGAGVLHVRRRLLTDPT